MNTKQTDSHSEFVRNNHQKVSQRPASFRVIPRDQSDPWTALMSFFLVACLLTALAMCSWQVEGWQNTRTANTRPANAVANQGFCVKAERAF